MSGFVFVAVGAIGGAWTRYLVGESLDSQFDGDSESHITRPVSTLVVNVLGSFLAGLLVGIAPSDSVSFLVGVGFCGALTTFSSFVVETTGIAQHDRPRLALLNAVGTLAGALVAVLAGIALGAGLW